MSEDGDIQGSITRLKLIRALKTGQEDVAKVISEHSEVTKQRNLLLMAVQISSLNTIEWLIKTYQLDVNSSDAEGNTPLHIAARMGRQDVALYLLSRKDINDTLVNSANRQAVEVAKTPELAESMQISRARYVERIANELRTHLNNQDVEALEELLSHPRAAALLDINGQDPDSGSTVLHDFVRKRNAKMVEFILSHGGDPFTRNSKGVLPSEVCKDDNIKRLLKAASKEQPVISQKPVQEAPSIKGYLKKWTNFTGGYKLRWFELENGVLSYYKRQDDTDKTCRGSINMKNARLHLDSSEKMRFEIYSSGSTKFHLKANHPVETNRWVWSLTNAIQFAKDQERERLGRNTSMKSLSKTKSNTIDPTAQFSKDDASTIVDSASSIGAGTSGGITQAGSSVGAGGHKHAASFFENDLQDYYGDDGGLEDDDESDISEEIPYENQQTVVEDTIRLEVKAIHGLINSLNASRDAGTLSEEVLTDGLSTISQVIDTINSSVGQLVKQVEHRESCFVRKLERSEAQQKLWAQNIRALEIEHERVQQDFQALQIKHESDANSDSDTDDEFFDVESESETLNNDGAVAGVVGEGATGSESGPKESAEQQKVAEIIEREESFKGYEDGPRKKMSIDDDKRPKISLWGVLKNLIGKDMTRMTLPVSFNECTNLLQRSAEDMEYVDLLEKAARTNDEALRMAYTAAFCVSSYSSTINRIAKPFNPLLGETFEYSRPDKGYRLFAEQVSHHPPIGALFAEHKKWDFFGNSNVISKFNGRSFEIKPTGKWFVKLRPDSGGEELISFRKVTSSVVGIITGRPVVDNHGEMNVENHTTGWKCKLTLPAMGWRSNNAYVVSGEVVDPKGVPHIAISGKWNDKIFYQRITGKSEGDGSQETDETSTAASAGSSASPSSHKVCIWQQHERPKAPFNLTPFAITLNALPERLKEYVAPTDTRLRPDQRAMEEGRYDDASEDKHRVEVKQRTARKEREAKGETYKPKWFDETKHPVTGDLYYKPHGDYWQKRQEGKLKELSMDIF